MATILVVDDEQMICDLLKAVLERQGHQVHTVTRGDHAVAQFLERKPQITLLDMLMPGQDGVTVLKQIRAIDPRASIIMLTGAGTVELEHEARELGVTDFLKKGYTLETLMKALDRVLTPKMEAAAKPAAPGTLSKEQPGASILVVDNEAPICDLISKFLTRQGYQVRTAKSGAEALALIHADPPQVILLDLHMPGMTGIDVLKELKSHHYAGGVIALSGSQDRALLQEMFRLGAVDVIGKPVDLQRLGLVVAVNATLAATA